MLRRRLIHHWHEILSDSRGNALFTHACLRENARPDNGPEGQERQVDMFQGEPVASRAEVTDVIMGKLNLCVARR